MNLQYCSHLICLLLCSLLVKFEAVIYTCATQNEEPSQSNNPGANSTNSLARAKSGGSDDENNVLENQADDFIKQDSSEEYTTDLDETTYDYFDDEVLNVGGKSMAFVVTVQTGGQTCSGVLIHRDFVISAAHCFESFQQRRDENGDLIFDTIAEISIDKSGSEDKPDWFKPINTSPEGGQLNANYWRSSDKIFSLPYQTGKLYKGNDLALIKLGGEEYIQMNHRYMAPICLPDPEKENLKGDLTDKLFYSGFGRRRQSRCVTDMNGPEVLKICSYPEEYCTHRTWACGVRFSYENRERKRCITSPTPSSKNKICQDIVNQNKKQDFKKRTFVFGADGKYETTCYPFYVNKKSKGWCGTRNPTENTQHEIKEDSGWGYCSDTVEQKFCNDISPQTYDLAEFETTHLNNDQCLKQLTDNMAIELPHVSVDEFKDLEGMNIICTGKNLTLPHDSFDVLRKGKKGYESIEMNEEIKKAIEKVDPNIFGPQVDGGACLGDSGGPLYKYNKEKKPVLVGIMSFVLWGVCRSEYDPAYYIKVQENLDFIFKHVPKDELCLG